MDQRKHREEDAKEGDMFERMKIGERDGNEDTDGEGKEDRGGSVKITGV